MPVVQHLIIFYPISLSATAKSFKIHRVGGFEATDTSLRMDFGGKYVF